MLTTFLAAFKVFSSVISFRRSCSMISLAADSMGVMFLGDIDLLYHQWILSIPVILSKSLSNEIILLTPCFFIISMDDASARDIEPSYFKNVSIDLPNISSFMNSILQLSRK